MTSHMQAQDAQPVRDTYNAYPADMHGFFHGWCESKRYTVQEVIGRGSYGVVCAALDTQTGEKVAIKKIQNVFENVADATRILREIKLLRLLKHPDVVDIKHIMLPPDPRNFKDIYVVFELMESDLHTVIGANDDLTQDHHRVFLYQLLRGLDFIHASGVLHRDLKPKNILANSNCKLKICDFGLARPFISEQGMTPVFWTDYVATRWYRAPELCGCFYGRYSQAVDIWSLGCIFAEVLTGKPLFPGRDAVSQLQLITDLLGKPCQLVIDRINNQKARAFLSNLAPKEPCSFAAKFPMATPLARDLLRRLLSFDPSERPTAAEALCHPYFADLPSAVCVEAAGVGKADFGFESHKLTEAEVRQLIFTEVLSYHPNVLALYNRTGRTAHYAPLTHSSGDDFRRQFVNAEQHLAAANNGAPQANGNGHWASNSGAGQASSSGMYCSPMAAPADHGSLLYYQQQQQQLQQQHHHLQQQGLSHQQQQQQQLPMHGNGSRPVGPGPNIGYSDNMPAGGYAINSHIAQPYVSGHLPLCTV